MYKRLLRKRGGITRSCRLRFFLFFCWLLTLKDLDTILLTEGDLSSRFDKFVRNLMESFG